MKLINDIKEKQNARAFELSGVQFIDLFSPYYISRKTIYEFVRSASIKYVRGGVILDFGCGDRPYEKIFTECQEYIGCDVEASGHSNENKRADVYYNGQKLPFETEYFDTILATQVFEHVEFFEDVFKEVVRVLKKEGIIIITVPFCGEEHEKPYDFRRFTSFGLKKLFRDNNIEIVEIKKSTSYLSAIRYMRCTYYHNVYRKKKSCWNFILNYVNCFVTNLGFILFESGNHGKDEDMGIDLLVVGKKN